MDKVMKALKDDQVYAVGVYGMGGVGKTTVVKHVSAQACKYGIFHHVIMAVVSQNPDFEELQDALAEKLGFKLLEETEIGRIGRLNKEIMRREKLLIILDDVWGRTELSKIGIPSYKEFQKCKSKVLITTRRLNVCHTMESQATIQKSIDFYQVARKVARECAGLPVALIAVARALGDKDFEDWKEAARRLEMSQLANPDEEKDVFNCIKLSYDYLDSDDAKFCFLLCCLFPEDYDIEIEDLMKYEFGTGLFRDANSTIENARARANSVTKYLKASCLLLDSTKEGRVSIQIADK
ncbi:hypothetical protein ACLB2K_027457 [Fragaria x ananassa]